MVVVPVVELKKKGVVVPVLEFNYSYDLRKTNRKQKMEKVPVVDKKKKPQYQW